MNEVKKAKLLALIKEYDETKSIHAACEACTLLIEEIKAGRIML